MNLHTGERPHACDFPGCNKRFKHKSRLPPHKKAAHGFDFAHAKRRSHNYKKNKNEKLHIAALLSRNLLMPPHKYYNKSEEKIILRDEFAAPVRFNFKIYAALISRKSETNQIRPKT